MDINELMGQLQSDLTRMVKKATRLPQPSGSILRPSAAIDWEERWIQCLMVFHVALFVLFLSFRNNIDFQTLQFLIICVLVSLSERLNSYCALHWRAFSNKTILTSMEHLHLRYFQVHILLVGFAQLINFLRLTSSALIKAKRLELRAKGRRRKIKTD